jgi:translocation and assembly module TamB
MTAVRKRIGRILLISAAGILLGIACLGLILVNTNAFRDFLRSEIIGQTAQRTGAKVEIGSVSPHWIHLSIDLNQIVIRGAQIPSRREPDLLEAHRLEVAVQFWPLLHRKLELRTIILEQPIVHVRVDTNGRSNLPMPPQPSTGNERDAVFDLAIQNCVIRSGQIYYNDSQIPLNVDLHDLEFASHFSRLTGQYKGSLSYDRGRVLAEHFRPFPHTMRAEFTASRSGLTVNSLSVSSGASRISLNAVLTNWANPEVEGSFDSRISTNELADAFKLTSLPIGEVALDGKFGYRFTEQRSFLASLAVNGKMQSNKLVVRRQGTLLEARAIRANYKLKDADLQVQNLIAGVLGGEARADWATQRLDSPAAASRLRASLRGVSLTTASNAFAPRDLRKIRLMGKVDAELQASWAGSLNDLVAHAHVTVSSPHPTAARPGIPVNGVIAADYNAPRNQVSFGDSLLQTASTKIAIAGTLDSRRGANSNIRAVLTSGDLHELASLVTLVQNTLQSPGRAPAEVPDVHGTGTLNSRISGSARNPQIQGQLTCENLAVNGSHWRSLVLNFDVDSSHVGVQNGKLAADSRSQITFAGRAGLQDWSLAAASPVSLQAAVADIPVADVEAIARLNYPVTGLASARASLSGTRSSLNGKGTLTLSHASAWNEAINNLTVNAESHQGNIHSTLDLQIPAGTILGEGNYNPATRHYDAQLHADGLKLDQVAALQRAVTIRGALNVSANGQGTIQNPTLQANLTSRQLQVSDQPLSNFAAQVSVADQHARITLQSMVDQGSVQARGDVQLNGPRYATANLDVKALPMSAVLAHFLPAESSSVQGHTDLHLSANGSLKAPTQMEAQLEIPDLDISYSGARIALVHPLKAAYKDGAVTLAPTRLEGTGTNITIQGGMPVKGGAPYAVTADGTVDLAVLQRFAPSVRSSGRLDIHLASQGKSPQSGVQGELRLSDAVLSAETIPVGIEGLNAQINVSGTRADIAKFSGTAGGGTVSAQGFVTYGKDAAFNLALEAKSVRIRYPQGLRSVLSGRLNLNGAPQSSMLTGRVLVDRLSFTQQFDLSEFAAQFTGESSTVTSSKFQSNMKLNVAVQSASDLSLASNKVSMAGDANLNVVGTLANPVLLGRIALTSGDVFFLGKRFEVQSGTIDFVNTVRTEPVVNLYVKTTIEQYQITLTLSGPADRLRTNYTSEPALPPADIIHLLAFGNTTAEAASTPASSATSSVESVLSEGVTSQVSGKLENFTGISQLSIDPLATNSQGSNPGSQVAIQERVTGSLLLTISTDVNSTQNQLIELQYQLNQRTSITVLRDQYGGYGIDVRLHKSF